MYVCTLYAYLKRNSPYYSCNILLRNKRIAVLAFKSSPIFINIFRRREKFQPLFIIEIYSG